MLVLAGVWSEVVTLMIVSHQKNIKKWRRNATDPISGNFWVPSYRKTSVQFEHVIYALKSLQSQCIIVIEIFAISL
jgi:hypothetical protein